MTINRVCVTKCFREKKRYGVQTGIGKRWHETRLPNSRLTNYVIYGGGKVSGRPIFTNSRWSGRWHEWMLYVEIEYTGSKRRLADRERSCPMDWWMDKRRTRSHTIEWPSEQCTQPLLESMIYVARRPCLVAPARSTILRRVGLLTALSSAARGPLILFVVGVVLRRSNLDLEIQVNP